MADEDVTWYQRLLDTKPDLVDVSCWTVIQPLTRPVTVAEVVRRVGGDPTKIEHLTGREYQDQSVVHLNQVGRAVVMAEVMGGEGVRDEVLRWLSDGAVVHSSWWGDANGRSLICYAAFGRLLTRMEYLDDDLPSGEQPTALDEDRAPLRGDLDYPAQLALIERRTGVRLDTTWLDQPHPTVVLDKPIPEDPRPPGRFAEVDPDLAARFLMADESAHRAALHWVLGLLADEHGLRGEPSVSAVLDALPHDWPTGQDLWNESQSMRFRLTQQVNASPGGSPERWRRYYRMRAGEAFAATVIGPSDRPWPRDTLWYAQQALQERWSTIRAELWRRARQQRNKP